MYQGHTQLSHLRVVQKDPVRIGRSNVRPFDRPSLPAEYQNSPSPSNACGVTRSRGNLARRVPVPSGRDVADGGLDRRPRKLSALRLKDLQQGGFSNDIPNNETSGLSSGAICILVKGGRNRLVQENKPSCRFLCNHVVTLTQVQSVVTTSRRTRQAWISHPQTPSRQPHAPSLNRLPLPYLNVPEELPIFCHPSEQHQPLAAFHGRQGMPLPRRGRGPRRPVALPGARPRGEQSEAHGVDGVAETTPPRGRPAEDQGAGLADEGYHRRRVSLAPERGESRGDLSTLGEKAGGRKQAE